MGQSEHPVSHRPQVPARNPSSCRKPVSYEEASAPMWLACQNPTKLRVRSVHVPGTPGPMSAIHETSKPLAEARGVGASKSCDNPIRRGRARAPDADGGNCVEPIPGKVRSLWPNHVDAGSGQTQGRTRFALAG